MLTPRFELSQDEEFLVVLIRTPYVKVQRKIWLHFGSRRFMPQIVHVLYTALVLYFHDKVADVDFSIDGREFKFYVKPYFLR